MPIKYNALQWSQLYWTWETSRNPNVLGYYHYKKLKLRGLLSSPGPSPSPSPCPLKVALGVHFSDPLADLPHVVGELAYRFSQGKARTPYSVGFIPCNKIKNLLGPLTLSSLGQWEADASRPMLYALCSMLYEYYRQKHTEIQVILPSVKLQLFTDGIIPSKNPSPEYQS